MRRAAFIAVLALGACKPASKAAPPGPPAPPAAPATGAEYTVIIKSTWTRATHPFEYPAGAHFSAMIGASHNSNYAIFGVGKQPTPGLERLSEEGRHSPLDTEIRSAIDRGFALQMFESRGGLSNWKDSMVATVRVDSAHPLISVVNMIAPSPDWFTGATSVNMIENGAWVARRTLTLPGYDSGGDDGRTYKAPDRDTSPKKVTMRAASRHFIVAGRARPVATLTLIRK